MRRGTRAMAAAAAIALSMLLAPAAEGAERRTERLFSFDGTRILTHFFPAPAHLRSPEGTAPTVMLGHGWGGSGATEADDATSALGDDVGSVGVGTLLASGYNVVTWDARGFGRSSGRAQVDSPAHEGRDTQMLIDWIARQQEAQLDAQRTAGSLTAKAVVELPTAAAAAPVPAGGPAPAGP